MSFGRSIFLIAAIAAVAPLAQAVPPGTSPGPGVRYATDAYPGFDSEDEIVKPSRKEPRWFSWINGPKMDSASAEFAYAVECETNGSWRAARNAYDALVREWPTSSEAPRAQKALGDVLLNHYRDYESAFKEYRYLLDFYSSQCDYDAAAETLYNIAGKMREEGKTVVFFRFANTVDVRRAYESVVLRAADGRYLYLRDIARVEDGFEEKTALSETNFRDGMRMMVQKRSGANTVAVATAVTVAEFRRRLVTAE